MADMNPAVPNPLEGQGDRYVACEQYRQCLDKATIANWESFRCDECGYDNKHADVIDPVSNLRPGRGGILITKDGVKKRCTKCRGIFPATPDYFNQLTAGHGGLCPQCRNCSNEENNKKQRKKTMLPQKKEMPPLIRETETGTEKLCANCRQYKPADHDHFRPNKRNDLNLGATCKECLEKKQRKKTFKAVSFPGGKKEDDCRLVLDFSGDLDLLNTLLATAEKSRRLPDQQVMWQLEQQFNEKAV
ncbi:MAG: hypothetical protein MI862_26585 [Desulfobacterales bacterium]|nr:hypothetical protein [Desulfobacterales bacterium]